MLAFLARAAVLGLTLFAGVQASRAGELADFNAAVEKASAHNRVALGYLRTGNTDLASLEIDRLRAAWAILTQRFAGKRPDAFDGNPLYATVMTDIAGRLAAADMSFKSGQPDATRQSLDAIRDNLYRLRQSAGIVVLADCVHDADTVMDALMVYNDRALDWTNSATRFGIASKASIYGYILDRCDAIAIEPVRKSPEFRRLVDGAKAGLALIPKAVATRDTDLLHRVLIELRSFENLLAFRFG